MRMERKLFKSGRKTAVRIAAFFIAVFLFCTVFPTEARADGGVLEDSSWEVLFQTGMSQANGLIQSVCVTEDYIITIENTADSSDTADIVTAYYKNDHDRDGNPVERYSVANRAASEEWEHGNGMCYNPNTHEIYVALYTNTIPENRGTLYVMDPDTLMRKGSIKLFDDCNILAIDYVAENDVYYIQTNSDRGYSLMVLNSDFQLIQEIGPESADPGYNFQDFCIEGDYILQFPLTWGLGIGEFMMAYSLSQNTVVNIIQLFFDELHESFIEPESIAKLDDRSFIVPVNATAGDNTRRCVFYRVYFPYLPLKQTGEENSEASSAEAVSASGSSAGSAMMSSAGSSAAVSSSSGTASGASSVSSSGADASSASSLQSSGTSSVSSASIMSLPSEVNVTKGNTPLTAEPEKAEKHVPKTAVILLIILAAAAAAFALYVRHVRAVRARREERMHNRRRVSMARMSRETEEKEFDRMLYNDFSNLYDLESWFDE